MATPEELAQRQEVATIQVETAAHIIDRVGNGTKTETVPTTNGPVPSVAKFFEDNKAEITAAAGATVRFCGVSATPPTTALDGSPLQQGYEYHNSGDKLRYSWTGTAWVALNSSAQQLEERIKDSTDPANGAGMIPFKRLPLHLAVTNGLNLSVSAGTRTLWELVGLVENRPVADDPSTWDWLPALQASADYGGSWYIPDNNGAISIYKTSRHVQERFNNGWNIFGPTSNRPRVQIRTTSDFTDRNIIQGWSDDWYAEGENDPDERPADLTAYTNNINRYPNVKYINFYVDSDAGGSVTPLDYVSMQETACIQGCTFSGKSGIIKGFPIRCRAGGGAEVSMNGATIRDMVVYRDGWRGMLKFDGTGSDVDIDNLVTANTACSESPFQFGVIDVTMRNLHSETYAVGIPTFDIKGTDFRVTDSFIIIRNQQGDIFKCSNPYVSGNGRSGIVASGLRLYPSGGVSSNVTNLSSINLYNDTSQPSNPILVPLAVDGLVPGLAVSVSRAGATLISHGTTKVYDFTPGPKNKYIEYIPSGGSTVTAVAAGGTIVISDESFKSGMVDIDWSAGSVSGAAGADYFNNPQSGRITLHSSRNASETRRKARLYTDGGPAIFSNPVWDATAGTLTLTVLISFTNAKFAVKYV